MSCLSINSCTYPEQDLHGIVKFHEPIWGTISDNAKDLIRKLLVTNPNKRMTAREARSHPWFSGIRNTTVDGTLTSMTSSAINSSQDGT